MDEIKTEIREGVGDNIWDEVTSGNCGIREDVVADSTGEKGWDETGE
jgi:hypothetical protein